jgi:hypothetical protein
MTLAQLEALAVQALLGAVTIRIVLTDKTIARFKPATSGTRCDVLDALVPNLSVRVTDTGSEAFVFRALSGRAPSVATRARESRASGMNLLASTSTRRSKAGARPAGAALRSAREFSLRVLRCLRA